MPWEKPMATCMGTMLTLWEMPMARAEGSALHASVGTMSGCLLNILLDPVFILPWGLDMGAEMPMAATAWAP